MQLEVEHTASLHLRSRRIGSDEAVYSTIDLLSTLLARLGGRSEEISEGRQCGPAHAPCYHPADTRHSHQRPAELTHGAPGTPLRVLLASDVALALQAKSDGVVLKRD